MTTVGLNGNPAEVIVELFHPDNSDPWYAVTARDITERNKAESEIKKFKKTLDQSQDEIYMFYPDTLKLTYMNNMAKKVCNVGKAGYIGLTFKDFADSFNRETFLERAKDLLSGRKKQINYRSINRTQKPVNISLQIIEAADSTKQFVLIANDISEQLAADKAKSEFIATVSHELRTPLTSIKGALGIIDAGVVGDMSSKMSDLVSMALKNSSRLERLINDILDMEKAEAGKLEYSFAPVDLSQLVGESLSANKGYAEAHHVEFVEKGTHSPIWISGDYDRLMQVLANLMSNAAKFSNENDRIEVSLVPSGNKVRLSVKDSGCGIPKEAQATIFDKFTQADSSDQRGTAGTGLGLSIVKMMVESHGGTIDFISDEENGTEFFIEFDMIEAPAAVSPQAA
jgi:signal transduction histidine kinase